MSGVKRQKVFWDDGGETLKRFYEVDAVLASDYDRPEQELKRLKADRSACWAEFKVMTRSCLDAEKERNEARAERDALRAQVEAMRKDAYRYRWLRDEATPSWGCLVGDKDESAEQKDAEIDEAMRAKP